MKIAPRVEKLIFLWAFLTAAGCDKEEIRSYRVPKEKPSASAVLPGVPPQDAPSAGAMEPAAGPALHWRVPPSWKQQPAGGMRYASFAVSEKSGGAADVSVVVLPGDAGGNLANVNRWRGQIGLDPLDEESLARESRRISSKAGELLLVEFSGGAASEGSQKTRLLAAILSENERTWFFKMTGPDAVVASARTSFLEFLRSLHIASS